MLLPDEHLTAESDSAVFINGIIYDPIGSHLVEAIVEHAPGKMFKSLYKGLLKDRMASLARNEIAGYVCCKVLERLSRDDLYEAHELIAPTIPGLVERHRFGVLRTLMQRCHVREVDTRAVATQLEDAYRKGDDGFDITRLLQYQEPKQAFTDGNTDAVDGGSHRQHVPQAPSYDGVKLQASLTAQEMIAIPGALSGLIFDGLVSLPAPTLLSMAKDPIISRTLQAAMSSSNATIISRRKLIQQFYGNIGEMALDRFASRVVDAVWDGTHGLAFIRERIAEELAENEPALRDSPCGRAVWKNWKMDIYKRKRPEWVRQSKIKASNDGFQSFSELEKNKTIGKARKDRKNGEETPPEKNKNEGKSALQLARERHMAKKRGETTHAGGSKSSATGPNAVATGTQ